MSKRGWADDEIEIDKAAPTMTPDQALYLVSPKGPVACENCVMFVVEANRCGLLGKARVLPDQICYLYVPGQPAGIANEEALVTPEQVGLGPGMTSCGDCAAFKAGKCVHSFFAEPFPVDAERGCCNLWSESSGESESEDTVEEPEDDMEVRKWSVEAAEARAVAKYIRKDGDKWKVYSEAGKVLGTHATKDEAMQQLAAVEVNKDEPSEETVQALQKAYGLWAGATGKTETILKSESEPEVEFISKSELGTIYRITCAGERAYFAESEGNAAYLPDYHVLKSESFVQVQKSSDEKRYTLGVVYPHSEEDFHHDTMTEEEVEKAAWSFMAKEGVHARVGLMHEEGTDGAGRVVESYIYRGPEWSQKSANDESQTQTIKSGDWLMGVIWDDVAWKSIKAGKINGYSLQGIARKESEGF